MMNRRFLIILPVALSILALAACQSHKPSPRLAHALDNAGLEKAPTLGPIFRQVVIDYETKNYKHMNRLFSLDSQDELLRMLGSDIAAKEDAIEYHKAQLRDKHHNVSKEFNKRQLKMTKRELHRLKDCKDCPGKYLAYIDHPHRNPSNIATRIAAGKLFVAGEKITDDNGPFSVDQDPPRLRFPKGTLVGRLLLVDEKGNPAGTLLFVGQAWIPCCKMHFIWSFDFFRISESPAPEPQPNEESVVPPVGGPQP
jgi:hypothetical protein